MHFEQHCQRTLELYGHRCEEVHYYLDQYFRYFRNEAHRLILHHEKGAHKVAHIVSNNVEPDYGVCYNAAVQHIRDDIGYLPVDWYDLAPHVLFLCCREVSDARQFLLTEFPLGDFSQLEYKINY